MKTVSSAESLRLIVVAKIKSKLFIVLLNIDIQEVKNIFENVFKESLSQYLNKRSFDLNPTKIRIATAAKQSFQPEKINTISHCTGTHRSDIHKIHFLSPYIFMSFKSISTIQAFETWKSLFQADGS